MSSRIQVFEEVLNRTHVALRAYIRGMGVCSSDVDDIAQEVYMVYHEKMEQVPSDVTPIRWLKGVARNKCLAYFRDTGRRKDKLRAFVNEKLMNEQERFQEELRPNSMKDALEKCLQKLTRPNRKLIQLRYEENRVSEELSDIVGQKPGSVRKALYRIREALKDCISANMEKMALQ